MKVSELIELLKKEPQDIEVVYECHSERCLMEPSQIYVMEGCEKRTDGWIQNKRPDMVSVRYLTFPGN